MYLVSLKIIKLETRARNGVLDMIDDAFLNAWHIILQILVHEPKKAPSSLSFGIANAVTEVDILAKVGPQRGIQNSPQGFLDVLEAFDIHYCITFLILNTELVEDIAILQINRGFNYFQFEHLEFIGYRR